MVACAGPLSLDATGATVSVGASVGVGLTVDRASHPVVVAEGLMSSILGENVMAGCPGLVQLVKPSWSSVVAKGEPSSLFKLDYVPPSPPSSEHGTILVRPSSEVLLKGIGLWSTSLVGGGVPPLSVTFQAS